MNRYQDNVRQLAQRKDIWLLLGVVVLWWVLNQHALMSAIEIWTISEIYSHGFFIVPGACYLIWRLRSKLGDVSPQLSYVTLLPLLGVLLIGVFGLVGEIVVLSHFAAFASLPLMIAVLIGLRAALAIWFPLLFILFSIPVGDELVPWLQEVTTDLATPLIIASGVPVFRSGLFLEIPEGRFHVAEACSGIRFFIGSIVFGVVYAHVSYQVVWKKALFVGLSMIVPILANAVRVYGIIMIGHWSDMKYAVGADHLIYGWFFFLIVLFILIVIGELMRGRRDKDYSVKALADTTYIEQWRNYRFYRGGAWLVGFLVLFNIWHFGIKQQDGAATLPSFNFAVPGIDLRAIYSANDWAPNFQNPAYELKARIDARPRPVDLYYVWYDGLTPGSKLISGMNRMFDQNAWSQTGFRTQIVETGAGSFPVAILELANQRGQKRVILNWYVLDGMQGVSRIKLRLYQTLQRMFNRDASGALIALSLPLSEFDQGAVDRLLAMAAQWQDPVGGSNQ